MSLSFQTFPTTFIVICLSVINCVTPIVPSSKLPPPCDSNIYCYGPLLHTVQMSHIYHDDKTFVDQPLRFSPSEVLQNFTIFMKSTQDHPTNVEILEFVSANFHPNGHEFNTWDPIDWHENPKFLTKISNEHLRIWATTLHRLWKNLGRSIKEDVLNRPDRYSMIYVSNPIIVPGGRFREFYYWDSYWIQRGLLTSEMYITVKGMIQNFLDLVNTRGFVPNGGRIYYERSQPPLLISMMKSYVDATQDIEFLRLNLPILEKEFKFWLKNRMVSVYHKGKKYRLARYNSERTGPRPESYSDDVVLAQFLPTKEAKDELYTDIQSAAESGYDFSSRWFIPEEKGGIGNRSNTQTRQIIPIDLNSILFRNAEILAEFLEKLGKPERASIYTMAAHEFRYAIRTVLWDDELGSYFDYDMLNSRLIKEYYPSAFFPLWTRMETTPEIVSRILSYMSTQKVFDYPGGIPTSLYETGEQWDFPNAWPPMVHIAIEGLALTKFKSAQSVALQLAEQWIRSNYQAYYEAMPHTMFEKYDATQFGVPGRGGEYTVVAGFGWTNGIILDLLNQYGEVLAV